MDGLDEIDFGILHLLQQDARHQTPVDLAEQLPVTAQTVRNRIAKLENRGVIEGYIPIINYPEAGFPIRIQFTCSAPINQRTELVEKALEIPHVVNVEEMLSEKKNIRVLAVTNNSKEINSVSKKLVDVGLTIEKEQLQRSEYSRPFNHFGTE